MQMNITKTQAHILREILGSELVRLDDNCRNDKGTIFVKDYKRKISIIERIYKNIPAT